MGLHLNGHDYAGVHGSLDLRTNTLMVASGDPALVFAFAKSQREVHEVFEGEYSDGITTYSLAGGILKSGDPETGMYRFVFEAVAY